MSEPTYVPCPHCGHPYPMTPMQKELYRGRTLSCNNCAKPFSAESLTPVPMVGARPRPVAPAAAAAPRPVPDAQAPAPRRTRTPGWVVAAMSLGGAAVLVLLLVLVLLPPLNRAREQARRVQCASNMRQIGQAMMIYANGNAMQFPDKLDKLLLIAPNSAFVCPSCGHTPAPGATPQIQASNLYKGGHLSYVYVGAGMAMNAASMNPATTIVLHEPLTNHGDGINVLYADGSVAFLPRNAALAALQVLAAPPTLPPTTQPTAAQPGAAPAPVPQPPGPEAPPLQ